MFSGWQNDIVFQASVQIPQKGSTLTLNYYFKIHFTIEQLSDNNLSMHALLITVGWQKSLLFAQNFLINTAELTTCLSSATPNLVTIPLLNTYLVKQ